MFRYRNLRIDAVHRLCGGHFYCVGLERIGGFSCPVNKKYLTIEDIQIGHLKKDNFTAYKLYERIVSMSDPWSAYVPLCALCNRRMVKIAEEQRIYSKSFRKEVAEYSKDHWGSEAAVKFGVSDGAVSSWRKEFGVVQFKPLGIAIDVKNKIIEFTKRFGARKASEKFKVSAECIRNWFRDSNGLLKLPPLGYPLDFKNKILELLKTHTQKWVTEKYKVTRHTLYLWKTEATS